MRKVFIFISLLVALHLSAAPSNQGDFHFGYVSASAGYSSLYHDAANITTKGNWAALFGAGYEFRMHNGWVSAGLQFMREQSTTTPEVYTWKSPYGGYDGEGDPVDYYTYTIRQTDRLVYHTIDIPILAGYYNNGFYVGAGVKVGLSVATSFTTNGTYDLGAKYTDGIGIISGVGPYTSYTMEETKYNCSLLPQISLLGEIGYDVLSTMMSESAICHMLKIGIYAECGVNNIRPESAMDPIQLNGMNFEEAAKAKADATQGKITPYDLNTETVGKRMMPFYVGVKLTYLIGTSWSTNTTVHRGCQCYGN